MPEALGCLDRFLPGDESLPVLVRIRLPHAPYETIHPFLDGNGRVGRLLTTFPRCEKGILGKPVLYLSHYFKRHRQRYYTLLRAVRDDDVWDDRISFVLTDITEVSAQASRTARRIPLQPVEYRTVIAHDLDRSAGNGHRVLEYLFRRSIVSMNDVRELTGTTHPATNDLVSRMAGTGTLEEETGPARNRRLRQGPYFWLLHEDSKDG